MSCVSISRPICARRVRRVHSSRRSALRPFVALLALLSLALVGPSAVAAAADHVSVDAPLTLEAGVHALYEPSPELLVAVDAERVAGANGLVGLEVTTERGRAIVESLGAVDGTRSVVERHWISAMVVATDGVGRHVFRVRSVSRGALGDLRIRVVGGGAPAIVASWKVDDGETPDDDNGDILLVEPGQSQFPASVSLSVAPSAPLGAPMPVSLKAESTSGGEQNDDKGDILFGESCVDGSSALCPESWSFADGAKRFEISGVFFLEVALGQSSELASDPIGPHWVLTVYDTSGSLIAPESGRYLLPAESYILRLAQQTAP